MTYDLYQFAVDDVAVAAAVTATVTATTTTNSNTSSTVTAIAANTDPCYLLDPVRNEHFIS